MSYTFEYYFNSPKDLSATASDINDSLGCALSPYQGDAEDFYCTFVTMEFSLHTTSHLVNDGELDFESYQYKLDFRTAVGAAAARPMQLPAIALVVFSLHRRLEIAGMLVFNLQTLLARYEQRELPSKGKCLYDTVSSSAFNGFVSHLKKLEARMPESWKLYIDP